MVFRYLVKKIITVDCKKLPKWSLIAQSGRHAADQNMKLNV